MARPFLITVSGTYLKVDGTPETGTVTFRSKTFALSSSQATVMSPSPLTAVLDDAGSFTVAVPSTTDPAWSPVGWTYEVHVRLSESITTFDAMIPHDASSADLAISELLPVGPAKGNLYAPYSHTHEGIGNGGGGADIDPATTVVSQTSYGLASAVGVGTLYARSDHSHGTPALPSLAALGAAATSHTHAAGEITSGVLNISRIPTGTSGTTVALGNDSRFTDSRTPSAHAASHADGGTDELTISQTQVIDLETDLASFTSAISGKANLASPTFTGTVSGITAAMVGLGSVNNTSDASKPVSTATQTALNLKANLASPTFTGTVAGITKAMVGLANVDNTADTAKPVSTATQSALDAKAPIASPTFTGTVAGISKAMVGLGNVDNTADSAKPISTATQTALDGKAATSHTHSIANITNLQTTLDGKQAAGSYATSSDLTTVSNRVTVVEDMTPNIMVWNGSAYVESSTAKVFVGPNDPGTVPDGSVWIDTTP